MTKQELTDYCFMYWQHISKKMLNLMKDYPCVYIDNRILIHSLTYGKDTDAPCNHDIYSVTHGRDEYAPCSLHINPSAADVFLYNIGYKFHYDYVERNGHTYLYDEIDDKTMDRFIGIVLYIANNEYQIIKRMQDEVDLINHIKKAVGK